MKRWLALAILFAIPGCSHQPTPPSSPKPIVVRAAEPPETPPLQPTDCVTSEQGIYAIWPGQSSELACLWMNITNTSKWAIVGIEGEITATNPFGEVVLDEAFQRYIRIEPNKTFTYPRIVNESLRLPLSDSEFNELRSVDSKTLEAMPIKFKPIKVLFADGSVVTKDGLTYPNRAQ